MQEQKKREAYRCLVIITDSPYQRAIMRIFSRFPYTGLLSDAWDRHSQFRMVRIMRSWKYPEKYHTLFYSKRTQKNSAR